MARLHCVTHPLFNRRLLSKLRKFNLKPNFIKKKHQSRRERKGRNTKRGPTLKAMARSQNEREEKAPAQIQIRSLGIKPLTNCVHFFFQFGDIRKYYSNK